MALVYRVDNDISSQILLSSFLSSTSPSAEPAFLAWKMAFGITALSYCFTMCGLFLSYLHFDKVLVSPLVFGL